MRHQNAQIKAQSWRNHGAMSQENWLHFLKNIVREQKRKQPMGQENCTGIQNSTNSVAIIFGRLIDWWIGKCSYKIQINCLNSCKR
jgi:hypothetical protein